MRSTSTVTDELPEGLQFVASQPEATRVGDAFTWPIGLLPSGLGSIDHAAGEADQARLLRAWRNGQGPDRQQVAHQGARSPSSRLT